MFPNPERDEQGRLIPPRMIPPLGVHLSQRTDRTSPPRTDATGREHDGIFAAVVADQWPPRSRATRPQDEER